MFQLRISKVRIVRCWFVGWIARIQMGSGQGNGEIDEDNHGFDVDSVMKKKIMVIVSMGLL